MGLDKTQTEQISENIQKIFELRERMESVPWIRLRNRLASELADKRRESGVTQTDMAKALNTSNGSITRFESMTVIKDGEPVEPSNPTIKTIASYAEVLGLELDFRLIPLEKS